MEAFSLLKYWRAGGGGGPGGATATAFTAAKATTKTIVDGAAAAGVSPYSSESEDGPYFDLEFALPDHESDTDEQEQTTAELHENDVVKTEDETESEEISVHENDDEEEEEDEAELKFSLTSNECPDQNAALSPSDDLFFKGDLVTIEPSSILLNGSEEENPKFPVFLGKSASKFRVLLLKLKKSKSVNGENPETPDSSGTPPKIAERENQGKTTSGKFFVKFKVEEAPPLVNLFSRDNSSKEIHGKAPTKQSCGGGGVEDSEANSVSDERKLSKEVMNKYLKMVKPFYIRVSKRYVEKLKFPGGGGGGSKGCAAALSPEGNVKNSQQKQGKNLQAGLKVVRKHLGKSRSASASAAAAAPPASDRRDDSLLQLQDGIQGAILHCKKSFNASRDVDSSSILCRSVSDPSHEKCVTLPKFSRASSSTSGSEAKKSGLDNI
ncbi:probable membrane-associated kinase regulator 2 isoform X1 [Salvia miltiorrhiza]|uniref:probable membrane-associated kinase regulator 2 isoform X1 n=1 Tax=Salvia miltiorrhiza TaxID=226208 RepID=UPI0025ABFBF6|nr:probable membrane-associated kinase regulator 2 isoform X1 [Salvia miltiorrhiza]